MEQEKKVKLAYKITIEGDGDTKVFTGPAYLVMVTDMEKGRTKGMVRGTLIDRFNFRSALDESITGDIAREAVIIGRW